MTSENIRSYCEEALAITEQQGIQDGLAFLIGEKFSLTYYQLKTAHNKLKYLYPDSSSGNQSNAILKGNKTLQLSYSLAINENCSSKLIFLKKRSTCLLKKSKNPFLLKISRII